MFALFTGGSATHNVVWAWIGPLLSWTFGALWILPLFVLSKIVNSLWFQVGLKEKLVCMCYMYYEGMIISRIINVHYQANINTNFEAKF